MRNAVFLLFFHLTVSEAHVHSLPISPDARVADSAQIDRSASIGEGTTVWSGAHIRDHARVGAECVIGEGVYVGEGVAIGDRCKVQNAALLYEPASIDDGVFIGPGVVLTNDRFPRAVRPEGSLKSSSDWEPVGVSIREGASVGARAVCVAPVTVGRWAMVAAGAVVTRHVPDFALVAGTPARQIGWVGRAGARLIERDGWWLCPQTGERYQLADGVLVEVER
jgi:UDP-2-acetamido-3-amino-2,3-dideoxy-glucuronate N-acetyltransferase